MPRGRKAAKGTFKCDQCDRSFAMAAHLGRHKATIHGAKSPRSTVVRRKVGRPKGSGRPKGGAVSSALSALSLEELSSLINAARAEARRKIDAFDLAMR